MLHYQVQGTGPALVFLHGFCEDLRIWETFAPLFTDRFQVVSIDLPGFGKSEVLEDDLDSWADACFEVLDKLGIGSFSLVGHSMGGYVSLAMMEKAANRITAYVSFHSAQVADSEEKKENRLRQVKIVNERGVSSFVDQLIPTLFKPDYAGAALAFSLKIAREQSPAGVVSALRAMRSRPDRSEVASAYPGPMLVLSGEHDSILPMEGQKAFATSLEKGDHKVLKESGHMGFLEEPANALVLMNAFLETRLAGQ